MSSNTECAVFADVQSLYFSVGKANADKRLDFKKLLEYISNEEFDVYQATAYGTQVDKEANRFITALKHIGWNTKYQKMRKNVKGEPRRLDVSVAIAMDVVRALSRQLDTIILCSSNPSLAPLIQWITDQGVKCVVISCGIPNELREVASTAIEMDDTFYKDSENATSGATE